MNEKVVEWQKPKNDPLKILKMIDPNTFLKA